MSIQLHFILSLQSAHTRRRGFLSHESGHVGFVGSHRQKSSVHHKMKRQKDSMVLPSTSAYKVITAKWAHLINQITDSFHRLGASGAIRQRRAMNTWSTE